MNTIPTQDGPGRPCIYRVVRVSGTIRKAEEEAIRQAKQLIMAAREEAGTGSGLLAQSSITQSAMDLDVYDDSDSDDVMSDSGA